MQRRQQVKQQGLSCQCFDLLWALLVLQKCLKLLRFLSTRQLFPVQKPLLLNVRRHWYNLDPLQIQGHQLFHTVQRQGSASNHHPVSPFTDLRTTFLKQTHLFQKVPKSSRCSPFQQQFIKAIQKEQKARVAIGQPAGIFSEIGANGILQGFVKILSEILDIAQPNQNGNPDRRPLTPHLVGKHPTKHALPPSRATLNKQYLPLFLGILQLYFRPGFDVFGCGIIA